MIDVRLHGNRRLLYEETELILEETTYSAIMPSSVHHVENAQLVEIVDSPNPQREITVDVNVV